MKSNGTVHAARTTFTAVKKSIAFYDVTMSYGFENQFQLSVTTTFFLHVFLSRHFLCDCFVKIS